MVNKKSKAVVNTDIGTVKIFSNFSNFKFRNLTFYIFLVQKFIIFFILR